MIEEINLSKYPSNILKEYYEVIRELMSIILLLDGYKIIGEGSHKSLIEYLNDNYHEISEEHISMMDDLRILRNKIAYDGFFVREDYVIRNKPKILKIVSKLRKLISSKLL